ncbi:hypothetical protein [Actinoplanes flavus]|uniref:DUF5129 domain-containing protein n=1 Tax=Actinoplanes flavus TaxID=2820290 RepID=A0ABS3UPQ9_9ACTN|nr:hypothetical protein [Actinoplanes flavus]MBO3739728.1 hypothetical protein [Actinoplanes flavus]
MNILADMLLSEPAPIAVWAVLMVLALPALVVLASPDGVRNPRLELIETITWVRLTGRRRAERRARRAAEVAHALRFAGEVRVAATQAGEAVDRWQGHWQAAADRVDAALAAWQAADARWARCRATAAFGTPWTPQNPSEYASRERFLHDAVRAAADRGELPAAAVVGALTGGGGWDAWLHPAEQEVAVSRASAAHLARVYRAAVAAERAAWHDVQLARRSRDSLRREAALAEARATTVRSAAPPAGAGQLRRSAFAQAA